MEGRYDVVVSMYHDQGQIALKTAAFEGACTIYIGLDYVHLTVPHGCAMEIAGQGIAKHASIASAMKMAESLCFRSEEHTSELQSLMRNSYAVFCLKKKKHIV